MLIKPVITEKSSKDAGNKKYTFQVGLSDNKFQIKSAVEALFKVKVLKVTTSVVHGKKYRMGKRRDKGLTSDWKKATVQIKADQKIELFETAGENSK